MSENDFDPALLRRLAELRVESPRFSTTTAGLAIENEMYRAMLDDIDDGEDLWEVIDDVLAAASMLAATLTLSRHNVEMCRPCMAQVLLCFSEHVTGELAAYEALNEPDEDPSETPPFSGSIN